MREGAMLLIEKKHEKALFTSFTSITSYDSIA